MVTGDLNGYDPDGNAVTFTVASGPAHGGVSVDAAGRYTYSPDASYAGGGVVDSFTAAVSDAGSGFHIHGLAGLLSLLTFGLLGDPGHATTMTVPVVVYPSGPPLNPPSVERLVYATTTDGQITANPDGTEAPHVVINPSSSVNAEGQVVVFLPGTQGRPTQYSYILRAASDVGFHAIGLNYPNQTAIGSLCGTSSDPDCFWVARNEVLYGDRTPVAGQSDVTLADSIVNRLTKLLVWMNDTYPAEDWGRYLRGDGTVDWSRVVLAGHSQGGGYAGVLAKQVSLGRAVYFSSPADWNVLTGQPAGWTLRPNVTPASRQYGFGSAADTLVPNAHAFAIWDNLGLDRPAGGPVLVDSAGAPFSDSHQLYTARSHNPASSAPGPALKNHGITVVDTSTPVDDDGRPIFGVDGVWNYLLG